MLKILINLLLAPLGWEVVSIGYKDKVRNLKAKTEKVARAIEESGARDQVLTTLNRILVEETERAA